MKITYQQLNTGQQVTDLLDDHTLAILNFGRADEDVAGIIPVPLTSLGDAAVEVWRASSPVIRGVFNQIQFNQSAGATLAWLSTDPKAHDSITAATEWAYEQTLEFLGHHAHPALLKVWHYLPAINVGEGDEENYRKFCAGRDSTLKRLRPDMHPLPSATAIGAPNDDAPLFMYWLCAPERGANVENPRQVSAWNYPRQYGPRSPNFSRATLAQLAEQPVLMISGTASVVGHATAHGSCIENQLSESVSNLDSLFKAARLHDDRLSEWPGNNTLLRVYVRDPRHWPAIRLGLLNAGLGEHNLMAVHGEICRADLHLEIDGVCLLAN